MGIEAFYFGRGRPATSGDLVTRQLCVARGDYGCILIGLVRAHISWRGQTGEKTLFRRLDAHSHASSASSARVPPQTCARACARACTESKRATHAARSSACVEACGWASWLSAPLAASDSQSTKELQSSPPTLPIHSAVFPGELLSGASKRRARSCASVRARLCMRAWRRRPRLAPLSLERLGRVAQLARRLTLVRLHARDGGEKQGAGRSRLKRGRGVATKGTRDPLRAGMGWGSGEVGPGERRKRRKDGLLAR
eukprot:2875914-Pleurochrysis_carterae.AAC.1